MSKTIVKKSAVKSTAEQTAVVNQTATIDQANLSKGQLNFLKRKEEAMKSKKTYQEFVNKLSMAGIKASQTKKENLERLTVPVCKLMATKKTSSISGDANPQLFVAYLTNDILTSALIYESKCQVSSIKEDYRSRCDDNTKASDISIVRWGTFKKKFF